MTDIQLQKETDETSVLKTGTRTEIIDRLERVDNNTWTFSDMSNKWLRGTFSDMSNEWLETSISGAEFQIPRSRDAMIERLEEIEETGGHDILLEYLNDNALDFFWEKFRSAYNLSATLPSRQQKIKKLQIVKIKELQKLVRELEYQCQQNSRNIQKRGGNWRGHRQKREESSSEKNWRAAFTGAV